LHTSSEPGAVTLRDSILGSDTLLAVNNPRTRLFVLTPGYSRKSVRLLVFRSSSGIWPELHKKAFRLMGLHKHGKNNDPEPASWCWISCAKGARLDIYDPSLNPGRVEDWRRCYFRDRRLSGWMQIVGRKGCTRQLSKMFGIPVVCSRVAGLQTQLPARPVSSHLPVVITVLDYDSQCPVRPRQVSV
jgi:hypothetical protein